MKKLILALFAFTVLTTSFTDQSFALENCRNQNFLISAYYSPLPGQAFYMRGSYDADIRLNGRGTNGADGTEVYMGLLAAPSAYKFGTKIVLGEMGIGTVHDRGGAIISKSNYHRIDIWMGKGEDGLSRALNWGMRFIEGQVCGVSSDKDTLDYTSVSPELPSFAKKRLIERTQKVANGGTYYFKPSGTGTSGKVGVTKNGTTSGGSSLVIQDSANFEFVKLPQDIGEGDSGKNVLKLQMILQNIGFFRDSLTGEYDLATMEAIFNFQRENGVLDSSDQFGAGHFGKKTKAALESYLVGLHKEIKFVSKNKNSEILIGTSEELKKEVIQKKVSNEEFKKFIASTKSEINSLSDNLTVKEIQEILKSGKKINPQNPSVIVSFIAPEKVNKTKELFLP